MNSRNFHETDKVNVRETSARSKVLTFGAGAMTVVLALVANNFREGNEKQSAILHASEEFAKFGQKDFASKYLDEGVKPSEVTLVTISDFDKSPFKIADSLRAKDVALVAEEIYNQLDGNINTGDVVVIPNDQLNPQPRRLV